MKNKLMRLFAKMFPGSSAALETFPNGRVAGELLWPKFEGKSHAERQAILAGVIRNALSAEEQLKVSAILTFTPDEVEVMRSR